MKTIFTPSVKKCFGTFRINSSSSSNECHYSKKKKKIGSDTNTLVISDEGMNDMKTVKSLENSGLLIKDISATIKNEAKE